MQGQLSSQVQFSVPQTQPSQLSSPHVQAEQQGQAVAAAAFLQVQVSLLMVFSSRDSAATAAGTRQAMAAAVECRAHSAPPCGRKRGS